jgi:hypothetical protein
MVAVAMAVAPRPAEVMGRERHGQIGAKGGQNFH